MDTKKSGCPATFLVKCVRVYPGYLIHSETASYAMKKRVVDELKRDLASPNKPASFLRFYVVASPSSLHTHCPESVKASGDIHPLLANEIMNAVKGGTTSVRVIKLHLDRFVDTNYSGANMPDHTNTSFYPAERTIYSHVYRAILKLKRTTIDQEALQNQVNEWQSESAVDKIHFRPCSEVDGEMKPLVFCYQTAWQRDLLKKYGTVCLLDATYKTTKYDIPLFFITVKANVCYLVVGFFFVQAENTSSICEALKIFKGWNPDLNPTYWVTDFSDSEINAIEEAFPSPKVYLCSFHREQAWQRWLKKNGNLTIAQDRDTILNLWQRIAASPSPEMFRENVEMLIVHDVSKNNDRAVKYFQNQWLPVSHRWVRAFGDKSIFASINTTNGAEAMNRSAKYAHLKHSSDKTLTGIIMVLVNSFIPSLIQKYCKLNSAIKSYNSVIPEFLHRKTHNFTKHVFERYVLAKHEFSAESVSVIDVGLLCVKSATTKDSHYIVDFTKPDCSCQDFQKWKYPCKHFCAVFHFCSEWGFEKMNPDYINSPLICLDEAYGLGTTSCSSAQSSALVQSSHDTIGNVWHNSPVTPTLSSTMHQETREMCKSVINKTYNCSDEVIKKVFYDISKVNRYLETENPTENGLPLAVASTLE